MLESVATATNAGHFAFMSNFPNLDFALGENAEMIRDTTQRFATDKIAPLASKIDADDWFPRDELWTAMGDLGLHGLRLRKRMAALDLVIWSMSLPLKKSAARLHLSDCHMVRIPTCASTRSGGGLRRAESEISPKTDIR